MARKLTPQLEKEILKKATDGESTRAIAEWLGTARGIKISRQAIGKLLKHTRETRAEVATIVVREHLGKTVISDLERLAREGKRASRLGTRLYNEAHAMLEELRSSGDSLETKSKLANGIAKMAKTALDATARVESIASQRLKFAGADGADAQSLNEPSPDEANKLVKQHFREVEPASVEEAESK
jgi:hypothetical protein